MAFVATRVPSSQVTARKRGEDALVIITGANERVTIRLSKSGASRAKLVIDAPSTCHIQRGETLQDADVPATT